MEKTNWRNCSSYPVHGEAVERAMIGNVDPKHNLCPKDPMLTCAKGISFFNYAELPSGKKLEMHIGTYEEIYYIINGAGEFFVNDEVAKLKDGDAVFVAAGDEHGMTNNSEMPILYLCLGSTQ
jgi:mannose-6-phosphate isomerase-like protein (cupin superfamily)